MCSAQTRLASVQLLQCTADENATRQSRRSCCGATQTFSPTRQTCATDRHTSTLRQGWLSRKVYLCGARCRRLFGGWHGRRLCRRFRLRHRSRPRGWPGSGGLGARRGLWLRSMLGSRPDCRRQGLSPGALHAHLCFSFCIRFRLCLRLHLCSCLCLRLRLFLRLCSSTDRQLIGCQ